MTLCQRRSLQPLADRKIIRLFLSGDVMVGRGIDQILPLPCPPQLHEDYVSSAVAYVEFAEQISGRIQRPVGFDYIWGAALESLRERQPDARIVNLEKPRGLLTADQAAKVDALKKDWPEFAAMRRLALRFRGLLKSKNVDKLGVWLKDAQRSGLYASNVSLARCRATSTP